MMNARAWKFRMLPVEERIFAQVERRGACLCFTGCNIGGYGRIRHDGKNHCVHRIVWSLAHGEIPPGKVIMHTCDNPACIEITHLQVGTQADNIADMTNKGRRVSARGRDQGSAKLCEHDIPIIRHWLKEGYAPYKIANSFGVTEGLIRHIRAGRVWAHILPEAA